MKMKPYWGCLAGLLLLSTTLAGAQQPTAFHAGIGRVDITPKPHPANFGGVHDPLSARALVFDNGQSRAAVVVLDLVAVPEPIWRSLSERLAREANVPAANLMLAATHTHESPFPSGIGRPDGAPDPYLKTVEDGVVQAVRQATDHLQPARVGAGAGKAYVNVNRDDVSANANLGANWDEPSDKAVSVVKVETLAGEPLAILSNYAVHGVVMWRSNTMDGKMAISADLPGATNRFVDDHYGGNALSLWTSGAAGDQNPIQMARYQVLQPDGKRGEVDMEAAGYRLMEALGNNLGEQVIRTANAIQAKQTTGALGGYQKVVTCPAKPGQDGKEQPPIAIRLSRLQIGDVNLVGVSGEVVTRVKDRFAALFPGDAKPIMVTLANGYSGYIPDDASYPRKTFQVNSSRLQPGHAESAVVNGLKELMDAKK